MTGDGDVNPEQLACELRDYLLRCLPSRIATINATRAAVLKAAKAGPYDLPVGTLAVRSAAGDTTLTVSDGTISAVDLATEINSQSPAGLVASADDEGDSSSLRRRLRAARRRQWPL